MERTITYDSDGIKAEVVCRSADTLAGINRQIMASQALEELSKEKNADPAISFAKSVKWPLLIASAKIVSFSINGEDKKLDFDTYLTLPGMFTSMWEAAVYEVNPHWQFGQTLEGLEDIEKKARKPTHGSKDSSELKAKAKN
jgi:hypothetical protein